MVWWRRPWPSFVVCCEMRFHFCWSNIDENCFVVSRLDSLMPYGLEMVKLVLAES